MFLCVRVSITVVAAPPPPPPHHSAADDVPRADEVRSLVKDVWDLRQAKLRKGVDQMISQQESFAKVGGLSH